MVTELLLPLLPAGVCFKSAGWQARILYIWIQMQAEHP